ncbi:MazG nucleotide pyrophosphohydrolase domain-containing protein [Candidatus Alkanophaga liquidiphilum]
MEVRELQRLIKETYFERDWERGVEKNNLWLVEEVGEMTRAIRKGRRPEIEEEFADVLAWLLSLANVLGVDVEAAFLKKYGGGCPRCGSKPCRC